VICVFDVDHTILGGSSMGHFLREALKAGVIRPFQLRRLPLEWLKYKLGRPDPGFVEKAVAPMSGISEADLLRVAEDCFERRMRRDIYPRAESLIRAARARGERVILASASLRVAIRPLERFLGAETSLACELEFSGGITTGRLLGQSPFGEGKKAVVSRWLRDAGADPGDVSFHSDSYADIPLLEFCGRPVAVNPDRILARRARLEGWEIVRFG